MGAMEGPAAMAAASLVGNKRKMVSQGTAKGIKLRGTAFEIDVLWKI